MKTIKELQGVVDANDDKQREELAINVLTNITHKRIEAQKNVDQYAERQVKTNATADEWQALLEVAMKANDLKAIRKVYDKTCGY